MGKNAKETASRRARKTMRMLNEKEQEEDAKYIKGFLQGDIVP
jgi:hypothetical protein